MTTFLTSYVIFLLCLLPHSTSTFWQNQQNHVDQESQPPPHESFHPTTHRDQEHPPSRRYLKTSPTHTHYTVRLIDRPVSHFTKPRTVPAEIHVKIVNPEPSSWYSVTVLSAGYYTGSATYLKQVTDRPGNPLLYSWTPPTRGEYEIVVHELPASAEGAAPTPPLGDPYRFGVADQPGVDTVSAVLSDVRWWPPCSKGGAAALFARWEGDWFGPRLLGGLGLRTGWYFLPSRKLQCKLEYFTHEDLSSTTEERSIYVLGSGKERGIFLSLVDTLLDDEEKESLNESVIAECRGRAFVVKSNLKVMYQDWRAGYFRREGDEEASGVLCRGDRAVREAGRTYAENGSRVWDEIFFDRNAWPSVVLMSTGNDVGFEGAYDLKHFIKSIPSHWDGTLFLMDGAFSPLHAGRGSENDYEVYRQGIRDFVLSLNDLRVRYIDGQGLSKEMRFYSELGPDHISFSQHFHSHCNELYTDENAQVKTMKICSNITEVVAQLLLGHALGPKDDFIEQTKQFSSYYRGKREAMYCHACPAELIPFHITPDPDMQCSTGPLHPRTEFEKDSFPELCPDKCNEVPATRIVQTQSGVVEERNCPLEYFTTDDTNSIEQIEEPSSDMEPPFPKRDDEETKQSSSSYVNLCMLDLVAIAVVLVIYQSKIRKLLRALASKLDILRSSSFILGTKTLKKVALGAGALAMIFASSLLNVNDNVRSSNDTTKHVHSGTEVENSNLVWNRSAELVTSSEQHDGS